MDTRINFFKIGLFVIAFVIALLILVFWLGKYGFEKKKFDEYSIYFKESVAGLNIGSSIKYKGFEVGNVNEIKLNPNNSEEIQIDIVIKKGSQQQVTSGKRKKVTGIVTDATGEPIIGANVVERNVKTNGVITDIDGNYQLSVSKGASILVSYIGYVPQTIKAGTKTEVCLVEDSKTLDEVVVVGFGTQKKVNLTGAVASVSSEALANKPVANIGQALQGVLPNLNVSATSASPGLFLLLMFVGVLQ